MLYVHGKQLRSCWDGQLLIHTVHRQAFPSGGSLPVLSAHFFEITDNLLFFNQRKREIIFPRKNVPDTNMAGQLLAKLTPYGLNYGPRQTLLVSPLKIIVVFITWFSKLVTICLVTL